MKPSYDTTYPWPEKAITVTEYSVDIAAFGRPMSIEKALEILNELKIDSMSDTSSISRVSAVLYFFGKGMPRKAYVHHGDTKALTVFKYPGESFDHIEIRLDDNETIMNLERTRENGPFVIDRNSMTVISQQIDYYIKMLEMIKALNDSPELYIRNFAEDSLVGTTAPRDTDSCSGWLQEGIDD